MIIDTSAIIGILYDEPESPRCTQAIENALHRRILAASYFEAAIVIDGLWNAIVSRRLDVVIREAQCVIEPVTAEQAKIAREAYRDFGKGSGHPAKLNVGDCSAYALAKTTGVPLLFKGNDFVDYRTEHMT